MNEYACITFTYADIAIWSQKGSPQGFNKHTMW